MSSWIIVIDRNYPQHWSIADRYGLWDLTRNAGIRRGDDVYFWQSGGSLLAHVRATEDVRPLVAGEQRPWEDRGERRYTHRFRFDTLSQQPSAAPSWTELQRGAGTNARANLGVVKITDPAGQQWLERQFPSTTIDLALPPELVAELDIPEGFDDRHRAAVEIALRRGQREFRRSLLRAYGGRCAVTGWSVESVLEAAHISPYRGDHTNDVRNGLLLRSDIHTLFDLHLLTVTDDLTVRVAPPLAATPYAGLDAERLVALPRGSGERPDAGMLARHREGCAWFSPSH